MKSCQRIHEIGLPIYNGMWCYRDGWENDVSPIAQTSAGDNSTVYRFNLCSHTGTYLETSQHKLNNELLLKDFEVMDYVRPCKLVAVACDADEELTLQRFKSTADLCGVSIESGDALIVATGWGSRHRDSEYLSRCPCFAEELVYWLCARNLALLGVDTPIIENRRSPYGAVPRLFTCNPRLLLLAPLRIDLSAIATGQYFLAAAPLLIEGVSASLCHPLLFES